MLALQAWGHESMRVGMSKEVDSVPEEHACSHTSVILFSEVRFRTFIRTPVSFRMQWDGTLDCLNLCQIRCVFG